MQQKRQNLRRIILTMPSTMYRKLTRRNKLPCSIAYDACKTTSAWFPCIQREREMEENKIKCKEKFASLYSNTNTYKQYFSVLKSVEY